MVAPEATTDATWFLELIWSAGLLLFALLFTLGLSGLLLGWNFGGMIARLFSLLSIVRQARYGRVLQTRNLSSFLGLGGIGSNYRSIFCLFATEMCSNAAGCKT